MRGSLHVTFPTEVTPGASLALLIEDHAMAKKTAIQKLHVDKQTHVVSPIPEGFPGAGHAHSMVVSTPLEVDGIMRRVPEGQVTTLDEVRTFLARTYDADTACPLSTGIFINIAAAAAEEIRAHG